MKLDTPRWVHRPAQSNWGDFGANDQLGRLNLITQDSVLRAIQEVRSGRSFCLSLPLTLPGGNVLNPRRHPPRLQPTIRDGKPVFNLPIGESGSAQTDVLCDDAVLIHTQYSTQWDGFSHVGHLFDAKGTGTPQAVYYNGFRAGTDLVGPNAEGEHRGATRLGIDVFAEKAIQTRAILLDLKALVGTQRVRIGYDQFMRALDATGEEVCQGDILCLYTGFADAVVNMAGSPDPAILATHCAVIDGTDEQLQQWIIDSSIAALCADNYAVEEIPVGGSCSCGPRLPLHELCLFKQGIPLGELWYLEALTKALRQENRSAFLLTAPPLRLPGAVGSPVTPVATI